MIDSILECRKFSISFKINNNKSSDKLNNQIELLVKRLDSKYNVLKDSKNFNMSVFQDRNDFIMCKRTLVLEFYHFV